MAFVAAPTQGTGSNNPQGTLAGSWIAASEIHTVVSNDTWISTQNTNLIIIPQVYSTPI
jgi:hypothetical protein